MTDYSLLSTQKYGKHSVEVEMRSEMRFRQWDVISRIKYKHIWSNIWTLCNEWKPTTLWQTTDLILHTNTDIQTLIYACMQHTHWGRGSCWLEPVMTWLPSISPPEEDILLRFKNVVPMASSLLRRSLPKVHWNVKYGCDLTLTA